MHSDRFTDNDRLDIIRLLQAKVGRKTVKATSVKLIGEDKLVASIEGGRMIATFEMDGAYIKASLDDSVVYRRFGKRLHEAIRQIANEIELYGGPVMEDVNGDRLDPDVWGIETILSIQTKDDVEDEISNEPVEEGVSQPLMTDLAVRDVKRGDVLWITAMLKPKDKSMAYVQGQIGVLKVRVVDLYYNLSVLKGKK